MAWVAGQATEETSRTGDGGAIFTTGDIQSLESLEAALRSETEIGTTFVIPGDTTAVSALADVARAKCRTAERSFIRFRNTKLAAETAEAEKDIAQRYLNRLSDYLFVVARHLEG
jgi:cob(I)alamin adenosyltransferase